MHLMLKKLLLLLQTVRHLKLRQVAFQVWYRVRPTPKISYSSEVVIKPRTNWQGHNYATQSYFPPNRFEFLNFSFVLNNSEDWNNPSLDKLWLYNLHYFDDLNAMNCDERVLQHRDLMLQWIDENPVMHGNGWEPYPLSLRIVNWIKWCRRNPECVNDTVLNSLHTQVKALEKQLEFHILANHLFANIKALVFAGQFFEGKDSARWKNIGQSLLRQELKEQFLDDGAHYERSPMYHCILLWDMLDLICLLQNDECYEVAELKLIAGKALGWINKIKHPDGDIPFFNDSTFGIAPSISAITNYATYLQIQERRSSLGDSGFASLTTKTIYLVTDIGNIQPSYQPGHAHAESASFELSLFSKRVFVNSGINEYGISKERLFQRSSASHTTVVPIQDDKELDSSEVWSGFRIARRAKVFSKCTASTVICNVNGFFSGFRRFKHKREFQLHESKNTLVIKDSVRNSNRNRAYFYLHPDCALDRKESDFVIEIEGNTVRVEFKAKQVSVNMKQSMWNCGFGTSVPNQCIIVDFKEELETLVSL